MASFRENRKIRTGALATDEGALDLATRLEHAGDGTLVTDLSPDWWLEETAYGGYLAALLLRALIAESGDEQRPLSLTVHFMSAVLPGRATIEVSTIRIGASSSTMTASLRQGGACSTFATATFGRDRQGPTLAERQMPVSTPPEASPPLSVRADVRERFPMYARFDRRRLATDSHPRFDTGGWIRMAQPRPLDYLSAVSFLDSWVAAATTKVPSRRMLTLVYFVQFLSVLPRSAPEDDYALVAFRSRYASGGYAEDDGELWSQDGSLLARAQQVVLIGC